MSAQLEVVGTDGELGVVDLNRWAVAERGHLLGHGYTEIVSVHKTRTLAKAERTRLTKHNRILRGRYVLLRKGLDGRWTPA